jgi:uncharacterized protein (DUF488 family)
MARVLTIGVYGSERETFFDALRTAGADAFVDIRRRRAVRGPRYTYANARRLTAELERLGIAYFHELGLAPDHALLDLQHAADARERLRYSERTVLAPAYVKRYARDILDRFDFAPLARELHGFQAPVLFCIERLPQACHRSLVAPRLAHALGAAEVVHLIPESAATAPR